MSEKIEVILVDSGSSVIKSAEVIDGEIQNRKTWDEINLLKEYYHRSPVIISSVRKNHVELGNLFPENKNIILSHKTPLPIKLDYKTPETLGADRIALSVGAHHLFPDENNLIIDLGTCMTFDIIDNSGTFHGGIISPGLKMRMQSMAHYTKSLPDIYNEWQSVNAGDYGKTTKESLLTGSFNAMIHEIKSTIETIGKDFASINIILTGGDANFFESRIKAHIFAGSKIVEIGLYRIWKYQ